MLRQFRLLMSLLLFICLVDERKYIFICLGDERKIKNDKENSINGTKDKN